MIEILPLPCEVLLRGGIQAQILAACIRGSTVIYEAIWWDGRTRKKEWVEECEIESVDVKKVQVSFSAEGLRERISHK